MEQLTINWSQAQTISEAQKQVNKESFEHYKKEVQESDFEILDFADVAFYAEALTGNDPSGKKWTCNDVRRLNQEATGASNYDFLSTFENSDTDDVIDFY